MATISDVAKLSGMSVATVSRVINNRPHVSDARKKKVLDAMEQLGYQPMQAARQLRGSGSDTIAVTVPTLTNPFFAYLVNAIEQTCREQGYKTLISQTYGEMKSEEDALRMLGLHHADGIILCALENDWSRIKQFGKDGKLVVCNEYYADDSISMIYAKQYEGFSKATRYLLEKGYQKIAYCTGAASITMQSVGRNINSDRYLGFVDTMTEAGRAVNPGFVFKHVLDLEAGRRIMAQMLENTDRPDAVIAGSDEVATGMLMEALARGVDVPKEIGIVGVDDQPLSQYLQKPLTTIRQPVVDEGREAAKELLKQIQGTETEPIRKELDLELVIRGTA